MGQQMVVEVGMTKSVITATVLQSVMTFLSAPSGGPLDAERVIARFRGEMLQPVFATRLFHGTTWKIHVDFI